jgi:putative membrane protein
VTNDIRTDLAIFSRGFLMGVADVVPGVSGGTIALLTGIYPRLITALAGFNQQTLRLAWRGRFRTVAEKVDLRFLVCLGAGIAVGLIATILTLVQLLRHDTSRGFVLAAFLGMLFSGVVLMYQRLTEVKAEGVAGEQANRARVHPGHWGWAVVGLAMAAGISLAQQMAPLSQPSYMYLAFCGFVGITAMILPGISGAMLLLLLGVYGFLVHIPAELIQRENVVDNLIYLAVFAGGCVAGLMTTTNLLKWMLEHWPIRVSCFLLGLMVGAIPCLWPYQTSLTPDQPKLALRIYEARWFDPQAATDWAIALTVVVACAGILATERLARRWRMPAA